MRTAIALLTLVLFGCDNAPIALDIGFTLDFGRVHDAVAMTRSVTVFNGSQQTSGWLALEISSGDFVTTSYTHAPLSPGTTWSIPITWTPSHAGLSTAELQVGQGTQFQRVVISGTLDAPAIGLETPLRLPRAFIVDGVPETSHAQLELRNEGQPGTRLELTSILTDGEGLCFGAFDGDRCVPDALPSNGSNPVLVDVRARVGTPGVHQWKVSFESNDPFQPVSELEVVLDAFVSAPCELVLGEQLTLEATSTPFVVRAAPEMGCQLLDVSFIPEPGSAVALRPFEPPGWMTGRRTFELVAAPTATRALAGTLEVSWRGGSRSVPVFVQPNTPCLRFEPVHVPLGPVEMGCAKNFTLHLVNQCAHAIHSRRFEVLDEDQAVQFYGARAVNLGPGESGVLEGVVMPLAAPPRPLHVTYVVSTDEGIDAVTVIDSEVRAPTLNTQTFTVPEVDRRDVVLAVDTSAFFAPRRADVRTRLNGTFEALQDDVCSDVRFAFVAATADVSPAFLSRNTLDAGWSRTRDPDFPAHAIAAFDALQVGNVPLQCIGPVKTALEDAGVRARVDGFCITNSDERTLQPSAALAAFQLLAPETHWSVVTGLGRYVCGTDDIDDAIHSWLVTDGHGRFFDLCGAAWVDSLHPTGNCRQQSFQLSTLARPTGFEVRVDGQLISGVQFSNNGAYLNSPPPPGSQVEVRYAGQCQ